MSLATTAVAVVPSAIYHGSSLMGGLAFAAAATCVMVFFEWANAWRYQWEPKIRARWFYVNLTSPAVLVLTIQAIGWRIFVENDSSPLIPTVQISMAHLVACIAAIVVFVAWLIFSRHLQKKEPNQAAQTTPGLRPSVSDL